MIVSNFIQWSNKAMSNREREHSIELSQLYKL